MLIGVFTVLKTHISTVIYIHVVLYPSVTTEAFSPTNNPAGGTSFGKNNTANITWIMFGVTVLLSAVLLGIIVHRKRAKRNERYLTRMLLSLKI